MIFSAQNGSSGSTTDDISEETKETPAKEQSDGKRMDNRIPRSKQIVDWFQKDLKSAESPPPEIPRWLFILFAIITFLIVISSIVIQIQENGRDQSLVPFYIYVAAILGTSAYLFSNMASTEVRTFTPLQAMTRFVAGPLVAIGIYLLSQFFLEESFRTGLAAAGIAFLAGFSMEIFVQAFNIFARNLLHLPEPEEKSKKGGEGEANISVEAHEGQEQPPHERREGKRRRGENQEM